MGWIKDAKANSLGAEAVKAAEAGATIFTPRLNMPSTHHKLSGNIGDWAIMIAAVEESGWSLVHWAVSLDAKGRAEAFPIFRRA